MPKLISKSKLKLKTGMDMSEITDLVKILTGDPDNISDIEVYHKRAKEFEGYIRTYMMTRFNMGRIISNAYVEAGTRLINDNQLIINPIKEYLKTMDKSESQFIGVLQQNADGIKLFKKTYLDFKKSKTILDAIVICNNIIDIDLNKITYSDICNKDINIFPFKNIPEYESEKLNLKFIFVDEELTDQLKTELFDSLKMLYESTSKIHKIYNTPDIDIESVFPSIMKFLDDLVGDLKGCKEAKKIIKSSSDLFAKGFDKYFKNFQVTESPFSFLEDYISDIIVTEKDNSIVNSKLLTELSTVLTSIRKKVSKQTSLMKNAKFSKAINMVETALHKVSNIKQDDEDVLEDVQKNFNEVINFLSDITGEGMDNKAGNNNNA